MTKKSNAPLSPSGTLYTSKFLPKLGAGYESFISYVSSETSKLPTSMYADIRYLLDQLSISPIKLGYRFANSNIFLSKLSETLLTKLKGPSGTKKFEEGNLGYELKQVMKMMKECEQG